jgi:hypothetical protein
MTIAQVKHGASNPMLLGAERERISTIITKNVTDHSAGAPDWLRINVDAVQKIILYRVEVTVLPTGAILPKNVKIIHDAGVVNTQLGFAGVQKTVFDFTSDPLAFVGVGTLDFALDGLVDHDTYTLLVEYGFVPKKI